EWRGYGEEGVQVLIRGLQHANHPGERSYRELYRHMPVSIMRWIPNPKSDTNRATRMCIASLLNHLENANSATPLMIRTLNHDEAASVRMIAISFFTTSEDEKCRLNQLPPEQKTKVLPGLIRAMQDSRESGLRNNAANALYWFPEQRETVAPVLITALQDIQ